ncbi:Cu2+-exporting ATPase [Tistlia consotensis]|uniref:Cu2+-exporting ATPase n=1 Tax=Tistlia consotensis USBA 355 TaxID=560819 RepID=A0A1Y6C724_9PROT|nr:heavy metal translocating P-type ATPase [Tistlia consotensis]SMF40419.1 Cu2+-exporting ATPase [Tistlia consotensis USBA 355]SNR74970.1 Cu2+-exporting ATPase [Tistlia consotensis]
MSLAEPLPRGGAEPPSVDATAYVQLADDGGRRLHLLVEGVHCGGCVRRIERGLAELPGVEEARLNLTTRRLTVGWHGERRFAGEVVRKVEGLGYRVVPYEPSRLTADDTRSEKELLRCLAVAGFAAANVMLLSIAVWAGAGEESGSALRDMLHWFSALIALPAIAYAGRPFFRSALAALKARSANMDVPISLGVLLAAGMSLHETATGGPHAYFDSAVTLLFFLLVGRYLDRRARGRARSAAERLLALGAQAVTVLQDDGSQLLVPPEQVAPGATVLVAAGERIAVDGEVASGSSEIDSQLITGETLLQAAGPGARVFAGTTNVSAPLRLTVTATGEKTLLAEIVRLMECAEQRKARFVGLADRLSRIYAPVVHLAALGAFLGWALIGGLAWQQALLIAVAVLIVTCPCALGLAVPAVQVMASGRLMRRGILLKSATALERLAEVDTVVFDKTGTLTEGRPELRREAPPTGTGDEALSEAGALAANSRHPLARALVRALPDVPAAEGVVEVPGCGLERLTEAGPVRLGNRRWLGLDDEAAGDDAGEGPELWLCRPGRAPVRFAFEDRLRSDAAAVVAELQRRGLAVELLSGDRAPTVMAVAGRLGIAGAQAGLTPAGKVARLEALAAQGRKVLMVGDGLNDAPALAAASVSLSPSSAIDISQTAADAVFQGTRLDPVLEVLEVARRAEALVRQNFGLAILYNLFAVPLAVAGFVTPLIAAVAMSCSSLTVIGNALRLGLVRRRAAPDAAR